MENQIIDMLQKMQHEMEGLRQEVKDTRQEVKDTRQEVKVIRQDLTAVDEKVTKTQFIIETELRPNIQILAEGHGPVADGVNAVKESIEVMEPQLEIVSAVVKRNSKKLDTIEQTVFVQ